MMWFGEFLLLCADVVCVWCRNVKLSTKLKQMLLKSMDTNANPLYNYTKFMHDRN